MGAGKEAAGGGVDRVLAASFDGRSVVLDTLPSLDEVAGYLEVHSGAQVWVDVRTQDVPAALVVLRVKDPGPGPVVVDEGEATTVMAYPHTVHGSRRLHRTVLAAMGQEVLFTVHDSVGESDSKHAMARYIKVLAEKELRGDHPSLLDFRDMLLAALMDNQADEFISTLQGVIRELSALHVDLEAGRADTQTTQSELFRVHMFVEDEFPAGLLAFRELVAKLRMGAGRNIDLTKRHHELEEVLSDVDGAVGIKGNVEKTIELVSSAVHNRLSERSIEAQRRLQLAVWILTRISVLLFIPNLVFAFWRITPWIGSDTIELAGAEVNSFWLAVVVAVVLTVVGEAVLEVFLRRHLGGSIQEALGSEVLVEDE